MDKPTNDRVFLSACLGRAKLTLMREDYSGCLQSIAFYTLDVKDLQARGMVKGNRAHCQMEVTKMIMRIKEHRERAGMTQSQFGAEVGVSQATVISWESETYLPKSRQLPLLAQVLGCPIGDLFVSMEDAG